MADNGLDKFVTGLLAGALVGTAIGMLMAPKPGNESRQIVRERGREYLGTARERGQEYLGTARERAGGYIDTARERVRNIRRHNGPGEMDEDSIPTQVIEVD